VNRPWWQWRLDWDEKNVSAAHIVRLVSALVGISLLAATVGWFGRHEPIASGPAAGVGVLTAITSIGVSLWCALRIRQWPLVGMVVLSCLPVAIWLWLFLGVRT